MVLPRGLLSLLLITISDLVEAQTQNVTWTRPSKIQSCKPANFTWQGGSPPYSLKFSTKIGQMDYLLEFQNITKPYYIFTPNFAAGSAVNITLNSTTSKSFMIDSTSSSNCTIYASKSNGTVGGIGPLSPTLELATSQLSRVQCSNSSIQWKGGVAPYFLSLQSNSQLDGVNNQISLGPINSTALFIKLPYAVGTAYTYSIADSQNNKTTSMPMIVQAGNDSSCLLNFGTPFNSTNSTTTSSPSPTPSATLTIPDPIFSISSTPIPTPSSSPSSSSSANDPRVSSNLLSSFTPVTGGIIGGILGVIVGFGVALILSYYIQKRRQAYRGRTTSELWGPSEPLRDPTMDAYMPNTAVSTPVTTTRMMQREEERSWRVLHGGPDITR